MSPRAIRRRNIVSLATAYDEQNEPGPELDLVIPEDLSALSDEDLAGLISQATEAALAIYDPQGDTVPSAAELEVLRQISEGVTALQAEQNSRSVSANERSTEAASLLEGILPTTDSTAPEEGAEEEAGEEEAEEAPAEEAPAEEPAPAEPEAIAASAPRQTIRVNLSGVRARQSGSRATSTAAPVAAGVRDLVTVDTNALLFAGQGATFNEAAQAMLRRHQTMPHAQYVTAKERGQHLRQQFGLLTVRKPFESELVIESNDPEHIESVLRHAMDQTRLPGGSLVASGGWCAPSETIYDLCELETRDGLFSLPEVNFARGGINRTLGPDFASIFNEVGFSFTEEQDISGDDYPKPCVMVPCPDFEEFRLGFDGLCITAGLLQRRAYPEMIARYLRGALVAHDHKMAANAINGVVAGSTAVTMPATQVGATAPLLTAVELQVEHYRDTNRMSRSQVLEAVFPFWAHGAVRSDLSRREGVDLIDVPDARIDAWFRQRGVNPQFIYNWQGIGSTAASGFTAWPDEISFALYAAGTWIKGANDIISLDTLYDSVLLGTNDYTALFSEEGWAVVQMCHDSRVVTTGICPDGATHIGVEIACDGTGG